MLAKEASRRRRLGGGLYLVGVQPDLCEMLRRSGQVDTIGEDQIFRHKGDALQAIYPRLDNEICRTCTARVFHECRVALPDGTPREVADRQLVQ
jgi:SulP family sulfate permease